MVEVMIGALHQGIVLRQSRDQLDRVHPGAVGELEEKLPSGISFPENEPIASGELAQILHVRGLSEGDENAIGDQELVAGFADAVGMVNGRERAPLRH